MSGPRTPGHHVQAINKYLGVGAGKLDSEEKSVFEKFSDTVYPNLPALGVFWEEACASFYSSDVLIPQPCELARDGIYGTPDGLMPNGWDGKLNEFSLWECKLTTKKHQPIEDCWMYLRQGMAYCSMLENIRYVTYDVMWLCGDYSRPYQPVWDTTVVQFSDQECDRWWANMLRVKDKVQPE